MSVTITVSDEVAQHLDSLSEVEEILVENDLI
jgi:predicted transcriptional regulator